MQGSQRWGTARLALSLILLTFSTLGTAGLALSDDPLAFFKAQP